MIERRATSDAVANVMAHPAAAIMVVVSGRFVLVEIGVDAVREPELVS